MTFYLCSLESGVHAGSPRWVSLGSLLPSCEGRAAVGAMLAAGFLHSFRPLGPGGSQTGPDTRAEFLSSREVKVGPQALTQLVPP